MQFLEVTSSLYELIELLRALTYGHNLSKHEVIEVH
jgi:hypothetical protein